jgi:hypothetical protein
MKKQQISIKEITKQILFKKKIKMIMENAAGMASGIQSQVVNLGKELQAAGTDATDEEVQAALLMAALDDKGKLDNVDAQDVDAVAGQIKEARGYTLAESGGGLIHTLEMVGNILGNTALLNVIAKAVEKATGKKVDPSKMAAGITKMAGFLKKLTGLPAKAMEKFFGFIAGKMGGGDTAQKIAGYAGTMVVVLVFFALGTLFFPVLGASPLMIILSLTGLVGKGFEIAALWKHIKEAIAQYKQEKGKGSETLPDLQPA